MGPSVTGAWQGGSRPKGVAGALHCSSSGSLALWGKDVGRNATDGEGPGKFPVQGREEDHRETTAAKEGRELTQFILSSEKSLKGISYIQMRLEALIFEE